MIGAAVANDILKAANFPGALTFFQLSSLHRPESLRVLLSDAARASGLEVVVLTNCDLGGLKDWSIATASSQRIIVVDDLQMGLSRLTLADELASVRPLVTAAREAGGRVVMLSTSPASLFPVVLGSSVLLDCSIGKVSRLTADEVEFDLTGQGISKSVQQRLLKFACGSRRLLADFVTIELGSGSGNQKRRLAQDAEREVAMACFAELGASTLSCLENWLLDLKYDEVDDSDGQSLVTQPLKNAGLAKYVDGNKLRLLPMENRDLWKQALIDSLIDVVDPPDDWARLVEDLFRFERSLRSRIRQGMLQKYGAEWAATALAPYSSKITNLAGLDRASVFSSVDHVWAPLDWLSMSELLEIALVATEDGSKFLGCSSQTWREVQRNVTPVRNRVAHMRLPGFGDREIVRKYRRRLEIASGLNFT